MQYTSLILGIFIILFGVVTAIGSIRSPEQLVRLKYMRAKLGDKMGYVIHTIAYVLVPLIFGFFVARAGIQGIGIIEFITSQPH